MRCVLHAGAFKTGSTSIQQTLAAQDLPDATFFRFHGDANCSAIMSQAYETDPEGRQRFHPQKPEYDPSVREVFLKRLDEGIVAAARAGKTLVISAERIIALSREAKARLASDLSLRFDEVAVICYRRPPADLAASVFQEVCKRRLPEFPTRLKAAGMALRVRDLDGAFGRERVTVVPFDREWLAEGDVLVDFARRTSLSIDLGRAVRANERMSLEAAAFLYAAHRVGAHGGPVLGRVQGLRLAGACIGVGERRLKFSPAALAPLSGACLEGARWLCERMAYPLERFAFTPEGGIGSKAELLAVLDDPALRLKLREAAARAELQGPAAEAVEEALRPNKAARA